MPATPIIVSTGGNTAGNTGMTRGTGVMQGGGIVTLNQSTGSNGVYTMHVSATVAAQSVQPGIQSVSAGTTRITTGEVVFSNSNGMSFGVNGNTVTGSHNGITSQTNQQITMFATGNTTQSSSGTSNASSLIFRGEGVASVGITNGSVVVSVPAGGGGLTNINISAGTTSNNLSNVVFSNSNGVTFGLNGSTVTASVAAGAAGNRVSSYENVIPFVSNIAQTLNGASVSHAVAFNLPYDVSASFLRLPVLMTTNSTTLSTAAATMNGSVSIMSTWNAVVYSLGAGANSRSLQSVASGSGGWTQRNSISVAANGTQYSVSLHISGLAAGGSTSFSTQYSISNTNYSFTTNQMATRFSTARWLDIPFANSLSAGAYWLVFGYSTSSASNSARCSAATNCNVRYSAHYGASQANIAFGVMGSTNFTSGGVLGAGSFSTAGGGTTASIPISAISSSASNVRPYFQLLRSA